MKYATILLGAALALFSCKSDSIEAKLSDKTLKYQEVLNLTGGSLTFADIEDSRCPEDVQCVRAGEAIVTLQTRAVTTTNEPQIVKMCLGDCMSLYPKGGFREADTANISLDGTKYRLILTEVNPYPNTTKPVEKKDYNIKLDVEQNP
ncbi:hypothetical protein [Persicitalea jodogahamensis]|uniref:Lipoprotein n=1 Tax=Persicitalea jodogahamensis TaxID=402147 RepID=A0A8J3D936_9BACT|nr:hypothetical protein [Persicitalea jodogahamensis]GHB70567.1 hypothetical protein GCM10007390_25350 [Persicitalea jodogahamensis]